ncbi:MAG: nucleotidyltransferase family protein [Clostridia bacterium]|nr:nucleotidyltransferase family protein [Clostridia bacterium]
MLNVIILASDHGTHKWNDTVNKALLKINGRAMIDYVVDAFRNVEYIKKIVVVGNVDELETVLKDKVDAVIAPEGLIVDNIIAGVKYLGKEMPLLISSCDIPLITADAVKDFIFNARDMGADFCYPIVEKSINISKYPEFERTYIKVKEGTFTGGNIFYLNPQIIEKGYALASKLLEARKNPLKMVTIVSPGFAAQFAMGRLTIDKMEKKFSELSGIKARVFVSEYPEIGNDVDKSSDVIAVTAHLSQ